MANNYCMATVSPELPACLFNEAELSTLQTACGLSWERQGDSLYFFADDGFRELGEGEDGSEVDCTLLLQAKLRQLDAEAYPGIAIHGASICGKMRPDEFGGFAIYITRDEIRSFSSWEWLDQRKPSAADTAAVERPYSVLLLYPDYANDSGLETYYAFVKAPSPLEAVAQAQRQAVEAQDGVVFPPDDFAPLLVTEGYHAALPASCREGEA
jgi:hypothetical protein